MDEIRVSAPAGAVVPRYEVIEDDLLDEPARHMDNRLVLVVRAEDFDRVQAALTAAQQRIREVEQEQVLQRQRANARVKAYERQSVELVELEEARQQAEQLLRESKRQQSDAWNDRVDAVLGSREPTQEGTR